MSIFGGGHQSAAKTPNKALGIDFQGAQYGPPIPVVYGQNKVAGNCIWYGDFQAIAVQQKQSGGKGGGGSSSTTSYDYKASYQLGICEGVGNIVNVYNGTSTVSLASLGAVVATGAQGQAPWAHLTGNAALGYSGTVLVSFQNRDLGSSASLPNDNFEVAGLKQFGGGIVDANPAAIIADICTDPYHGINFGQLGNTTQYSNYCIAAGIFLSPVFDQQQTAQQALSDLLKYTNADAWFSEGVLKIGCYADESITGNGVTYTPNVTAVANLGPNDFITNGAEAPVTITRKSPADAMNIERLEYVDRANTYHTSAVTATIDNDVVKSGARSDQSDTYHGITNATVARLVAQNILQRKYYVRNQYEFQLSWRYCYLEPFDIVTLTDVNTGLSSFPVRILSVEEDDHGLLKVTAEEFPSGIGHGATYSTQANGGATVDPNTDPGPVAAPYLFRGPGFLVNNNRPEIWCAVTGNGNPLWAGCDVYLSHDGTSYTFLSTYARQARYGELTNSMAVQADPDTTSAPNVVLNGYNAQLLGGSQADADNFVTLAMIDNEIIAYETATLASGPSYNLSYIRRGGYGSTIAAHAANAPFVRLDDGILRLPVDPSMIGQTVYLKFLSRNCFGRTPRTLAEETAYTYVIGSNVELPDVPNVPGAFAVQGVADGVSITWTNDNPAAVGCTSIEYATASGGPWTVLAQVGPTTTAYHHSFTTGATYYYRARARGPLVQSGWSAYTDVFNSTGVDVSKATVANVQTLLNGTFLLGLSNWIAAQGWTSDTTPRAIYTGFAGASGTLTLANTNNVPCQPGSQIIAQALLSSNAANGACYAGVEFLDSTGAHLAYAFGNSITGTTTATLSRKVALAPAGSAFARFFLGAANCTTGTYYAQSCLMTVTLSSVDELPDGSTYARTSAGALTGGNVDLAKTGVVNKNLGNIADGGGRYGVHAVDGNNLALIDFSQVGHVNKVLDNIGDGATYARVRAGQLNGGIVSIMQGGRNCLLNPTFTANSTGSVNGATYTNGPLVDHWRCYGGVSLSGAIPYNGTLRTRTYTGFAIASGTSYSCAVITDKYPVSPGTQYVLRASRFAGSAGGTFPLPSGVTGYGRFFVSFYDYAGNLVANQSVTDVDVTSAAANTQGVASGTVPSSAAQACVNFYVYFSNSGAATTLGGSAGYIDFGVTEMEYLVAANIDSDVVDGTTYGRTAQADLYSSGGVNRVGVRIAGSGQYAYVNFGDNTAGGHSGKHLGNMADDATSHRYAVASDDIYPSGGYNRIGLRVAGSGQQIADLRNVPPSFSAGPVSNWRNLTISYTATAGSPATATINVSAAQIIGLLGAGATLSYNASSASVSGTGGTNVIYYLYYNDPTFAGGTKSLNASTNPNDPYTLGNVYVGTVTVAFPTSGSGGGGGGGGLCVADDMFIGEGRTAGNAEIGDPFDCIDLPTQAGKHVRALQGVTRGTEECVRLITSDGCALVCSVSTPFDLPDGRQATAPRMLGEQVITDLGAATVTSLALVGPRPVTRAHLGGVSYAAGADPHRRIYSHNFGGKP